MAQRQTFTVAATHCRDDRRFVGSADAESATEGVIAVIQQMLEAEPEEELTVCGLFVGGFDPLNADLPYAFSRPRRQPSLGSTQKRFTVVTDSGAIHVLAADASAAELDTPESAAHSIAAVFHGHLVDISREVDWDRVRAAVNAMSVVNQ